MLAKLSRLILPTVLAIVVQSAFAQVTPPPHEADLLFRDRKTIRKVAVVLSQDKTTLTITGVDKKAPFEIELPIKDIKSVDYTYTEKPLAAEAIGTTSYIVLLSGYIGVPDLAIFMPMVLTKKKRHWLTIETADTKLLLQLKNKDYRQLLLEMHKNHLPVEDSGKVKKRPVSTDTP